MPRYQKAPMTISLVLLLVALPQAAPDTVVVCPAPFRQALAPWLAHRTAQGHRIEVLPGESTAGDTRARIRDLARQGDLKFVVLVGDAEPAMRFDPATRARCVPVFWSTAEVVTLWDSPPHIGTDNWYADLDDDRVPELAVGRLTADTPAELERIVQKILAYENSRDFTAWRRRLNFVAGTGGFSRMADAVIESAAKLLIAHQVPPDCRVSMTYASWQSPYCPSPRAFRQTTIGRLNEGCWFWVYLGHGYHLGLDWVHAPDGDFPILDLPDVARLDCSHAAPIAVLLSCYAGAFDAWEDCLAEQMLRTPGAPVAVLAGSRVTMPYAMTVLGTGLMDAVFNNRSATLGEAVLYAKRRAMRPSSEAGPDRAVLDLLSLAVSPAPTKLATERAEHVEMFNLIGDPLLRLRHPRRVELELPPTAEPGQTLHVRGTSPVDGRATVELVRPRGRSDATLPPRSDYPDSPQAAAEFQKTYDRANDRRLAQAETTVTAGRLDVELTVPDDAVGPYHVRVFIEAPNDFAQAAAQITITKPQPVAVAKNPSPHSQ